MSNNTAFATAQRVSVWSKPATGPQPFTAWHEALRTAFEAPQDDFDMPAMPEEPAIDLDAEREEAFSLGYEEGLAAGRAEADAEKAALRNLARALDTLKPEPTPALGQMIAATVERLVGEIMGQVQIDRATLIARAEAAAAVIGEETRPAVLKLNPADVARLDGAELPVSVEADPTVALGALRLETAHGWVEDGPALRLKKLAAALDRVAGSK
jgi:flagellar assembly protein FliH